MTVQPSPAKQDIKFKFSPEQTGLSTINLNVYYWFPVKGFTRQKNWSFIMIQ